MSRYKAYPGYRDSEIEMIGKLPLHWQAKKVRFLLKDGAEGIRIGPFGSALKLEDMVDSGIRVYGQENVIAKDFSLGKRLISKEKFAAMQVYQIYPNDLLITMMGTSGKCELVPDGIEIGIIDSHLIRLRIKEQQVLPKFFRLLIDECHEIESQIKVSGKGSIMHGINSGIVKELELPVPTIFEQECILKFLGHETAKIDNLIAKQQGLIKLLKEKRHAVISHAVTKGINPNAPMRDSGVEWLGEVPAHWVTTKIGFLASKIGSGKTPKGGSEIYKDEGILFLRSQNIYDDGLHIHQSECVFITPDIHEEMNGTKVRPGDVLLNITGGSIGRSCLVPREFPEANVNQHVCILRFTNPINEYLAFVIKSDSTQAQIDSCQTGGNREGLNFDQISKISVALPPLIEQEAISSFLYEAIERFDEMEIKARSAIEIMQERRTALISAAVTGKIDVRDWQPPGDAAIAA